MKPLRQVCGTLRRNVLQFLLGDVESGAPELLLLYFYFFKFFSALRTGGDRKGSMWGGTNSFSHCRIKIHDKRQLLGRRGHFGS